MLGTWLSYISCPSWCFEIFHKYQKRKGEWISHKVSSQEPGEEDLFRRNAAGLRGPAAPPCVSTAHAGPGLETTVAKSCLSIKARQLGSRLWGSRLPPSLQQAPGPGRATWGCHLNKGAALNLQVFALRGKIPQN